MCQGRLDWDPLWLPAWANTPAALVDCQPLWACWQQSHQPIVLPLAALDPWLPIPAPRNPHRALAALYMLSRS